MINEDAVLETNQRFYKAINDQNLMFMKKLWYDNYRSLCLHPGGQVIRGYDSIIQSWQDIFSSPDSMEIRLGNVDIVAATDLAWVSCEETFFFISPEGVKTSKACAANIFKRVNDTWKMVLHHASTLPDLSMEEDLLLR